MNQQEERETVLRVAAGFVGTPYHHFAKVKGAGVDCVTFIAMVFEESGLEPPIPIERYSPQWFMRREDELLVNGLLTRCVEITREKAMPADIAVYKFGRHFAHGTIIERWPRIFHAFPQAGRVMLDIADQGVLAERERRFFTRKAWAA